MKKMIRKIIITEEDKINYSKIESDSDKLNFIAKLLKLI